MCRTAPFRRIRRGSVVLVFGRVFEDHDALAIIEVDYAPSFSALDAFDADIAANIAVIGAAFEPATGEAVDLEPVQPLDEVIAGLLFTINPDPLTAIAVLDPDVAGVAIAEQLVKAFGIGVDHRGMLALGPCCVAFGVCPVALGMSPVPYPLAGDFPLGPGHLTGRVLDLDAHAATVVIGLGAAVAQLAANLVHGSPHLGSRAFEFCANLGLLLGAQLVPVTRLQDAVFVETFQRERQRLKDAMANPVDIELDCHVGEMVFHLCQMLGALGHVDLEFALHADPATLDDPDLITLDDHHTIR